MSNWELLDYDPQTGVRKWIAADQHVEDAVLVKTEFSGRHTNAILDANKASQNDNRGRMGDVERVASIPTAVMYEWLTKFGVNAWNPQHMDAVKKLLNSSDYRYLKCREVFI